MTDALTLEEQLHHIGYEARMLVALLCTGIPDADVQLSTTKGPQKLDMVYMKNLILEGRCTHARNLCEHFTNNNDIKLVNFFKWSVSQADLEALDALKERISKQVMHLTYHRVADPTVPTAPPGLLGIQGPAGPVGKEWSIRDFIPLLNLIKRLADKVLKHKPTHKHLRPLDEAVFQQLSKELPLPIPEEHTPVASGYFMDTGNFAVGTSMCRITVWVDPSRF